MRRFILLFICGVMLALSFYPFKFFSLLAWFGFVPFFFVLKGSPKSKAFFFGYLTGIIFWGIVIYWLVHVTFVGTVILVLYLALYFGIFGFIFCLIYRLSMACQLLYIPTAWVLLEYVRSYLFSGFGWALLGYSQYKNPSLIQLADIGGVWLVSFKIMLMNVIFYHLVKTSSLISRVKYIFFGMLVVGISLLYGYYQLFSFPVKNQINSFPLKVSIIQGNISQQLKWQKESREFIIARYITLSYQAVRDKPELIIWPEASLPVIKEEEPLYYKKVLDFVKDTNTPILLGLVSYQNGHYYNSAELIVDDMTPPQRYNKLHLVPFGEYIPLKRLLSFLETITLVGNFSSGEDYTVFKIPPPKSQILNYKIQNTFSVLICFEDLFPELAREFVKKGARFLVNITNDAWFGRSPASSQHMMASVFRAVENRVNLIRCANTGISAFILPTGEILNRIKDAFGQDIFIEGYLTQKINIKKNQSSTIYNRYPWSFPFFLFLLFLYGIIKHYAKL